MYHVFISVYKGAQGTTKDQLGRYCKVPTGVDDFALYLKQFILINHRAISDEIDIRVGPQYK